MLLIEDKSCGIQYRVRHISDDYLLNVDLKEMSRFIKIKTFQLSCTHDIFVSLGLHLKGTDSMPFLDMWIENIFTSVV